MRCYIDSQNIFFHEFKFTQNEKTLNTVVSRQLKISLHQKLTWHKQRWDPEYQRQINQDWSGTYRIMEKYPMAFKQKLYGFGFWFYYYIITYLRSNSKFLKSFNDSVLLEIVQVVKLLMGAVYIKITKRIRIILYMSIRNLSHNFEH